MDLQRDLAQPVRCPLSPIERAYWAGFFDGEGCVKMSWEIRKDRPRTAIRLGAALVNTNRIVLEQIRASQGGSIHPTMPKKNCKPSWQWMISGTRAAEFLFQIWRHTIVKHAQIEVAVEWYMNRPGTGGRWPPALAERLVAEMHRLNKRGTHAR